jgi:hypothetical protein
MSVWKILSLHWVLLAKNFAGNEKEEIGKGRNSLCRTK